jgi:hypothetical protein
MGIIFTFNLLICSHMFSHYFHTYNKMTCFPVFFRTKNAIFSWCPIFCLLFSCWYYIFIHFSHSFPYFPILISSLKWQVVSYAFSPYDFPVYYSYIDFRTKMALFLICVLLHFPHMISVVLFQCVPYSPSLCLHRLHPMFHAAPHLLQVDDLCTWRTKSPRKLCTFWLPRNVRPKKLGRNHGKSHEKCPSYILFIFIYEGYNMI